MTQEDKKHPLSIYRDMQSLKDSMLVLYEPLLDILWRYSEVRATIALNRGRQVKKSSNQLLECLYRIVFTEEERQAALKE